MIKLVMVAVSEQARVDIDFGPPVWTMSMLGKEEEAMGWEDEEEPQSNCC